MIYISNLVSRRCRTSSRFAAALISSSVLLFGASLALSGCASSQEEQRYSWPLATASPEDTVTQLFAEKFAEEVHDLSNGAMRIQVYPTPHSAVTATCSKRARTAISRLSCRTPPRRFLS